MAARVGVDIGGTFTDLCWSDGHTFVTAKVPSTGPDYLEGVSQGLVALRPHQRSFPPDCTLIHGSTVATNALLTRRGARIALVATKGFGDVLHIGRQNRPELYELKVRRAGPIVDRADCFEADERIGADGEVVTPMDDEQVRRVLSRIAERGVGEVAVCLLFSFLNRDHERRIGELAAELGLSVTLSSDLLPEFREYERASTTAVNAYVRPVAAGHYGALEKACRSFGIQHPGIMQSNGGRISAEVAGREPVRTILSGPAGGVVAGLYQARRVGIERIVTYDMGGTSTDVCLCDGEPAVTTDSVIAGCPIGVPMMDIHTIGAGGGSIARLDAGGALQVGPDSAGADPGPACYGRGREATVTDANVVLGRIVPEHFLGGRFAIDPGAAERAVGEVARRMGTSVVDAALGIVAVSEAHMMRAVRRVSAERGVDPSELVLCGFGGAGGLHACRLAKGLGMRAVLIPPNPGILSATGMLLADLRKDFSIGLSGGCSLRSDDGGSDEIPPALGMLRRAFSDLMDQAAHAVQLEGYEQDDSLMERSVDMRYRGQSHELMIPLASLGDAGRLLAPFHAEHERRFGHAAPDEAVQLVTARIRAVVETDKPDPPVPVPSGTSVDAARIGVRDVVFDEPAETALFDRERFEPGHELGGPALIVEAYATTLLPPGWHARVEKTGALRMTRTE